MRLDQQVPWISIGVTSAASTVIVRMPLSMFCAPFCWLTHIGSGHLDLAECATSAGVAGFHRGDAGRVRSDCQDVFAHGFFSFLLGSVTASECGGSLPNAPY